MASSSSSTVMASPGANGSSYDVFLSFRGEDTRHTFTDHLYDALNRAGICAFRDNEEINRGEKVKYEIERAIKESKASIVVLSENYARSTWCLDELVLILEQRRECNHFVLPVFYHVEPTDVRKQNNTFAIEVKTSSKSSRWLYKRKQTSSRWTDENVKRWKIALMQVADLAGMVLTGSETIFLKEIVDTIYNKLDIKQVYLPPNIIGMATRYEKIRKWLEQSNSSSASHPILAICGMGGSGKTTLAKYIYDIHWKTFEIMSFLEDINSRCKRPNDLLELGKQLNNDVLGGKRRKLPSVSRGILSLQEARWKRGRGLIILDDIADHRQLVNLIGSWERDSGIKIIITTTRNTDHWFDPRILQYKMELLNDDHSSELLSRHAFGTKVPMVGFEELVLQAVEYCEGNPLALEVLGSSLSINKTISDWESRLNLLEKDIDSRIQDVLTRSYTSLPFVYEQELFLHIASFFIGKDIDYVVKILEPDYSAKSGIKTLIDRNLISVSPNNKLMMHRLLQEMGKNIVRQESMKFPAKRSRVWLSSESYKILSKRKGSKTMEGLALDMHELSKSEFAFKPSGLYTDALKEMDNLKLLQLNFAELDGSYENFSEDLRWLCWRGFCLSKLPSDLYMGNLVAIDMSNSNLEVFEPPIVLQSLQILNLKDSHKLLEIHNISRIPHLEILILWNCSSLNFVCKTIGDLTRLELLNMTGCENLWKREQINQLVASTSSGVTMPAFSFPPSLRRLFLKDCYLECTESLPLSFSAQPSLQYLNIVNGLFEFLPYYDHLNNLRVLDLSLCSRLTCLLYLPSTLAELYIYYCESLKEITFQSHRYTLQEIGYEGCVNLTDIEGFIKLVPIVKLDETDLGHLKWLKEYQNHEVCLVGDDELTIGRSPRVQILYEFNIMSTSLPDIKDPNMTPFISKSPSLSFKVPSCPKNKRLKGINVSFKYTTQSSISGEEWTLFCKISTSNRVDLMYNPKVFGKPHYGKNCIWLSYWPIGNTLGVGDKVDVTIAVSGFNVLECSVSLVYTDDEAGKETKWPFKKKKKGKETMETNMGGVDILGEDLSGFKVRTGAYYLCRRDFYELTQVGKLTPALFGYLVGYTFDYTEVRGWRKTGRPKTVKNPSFTELKTIRCIIDGPELEDIYKIPEMSKSSLGDKTKALTSSLLEKEIRSVTRSKPIDAEIEEIYDKPYVSTDERVSDVISPFDDLVTGESSTNQHDQSKSYNPDIVVPIIESPYKKIMLEVKFSSQSLKHRAMDDLLTEHQGIISIHFDSKEGRLTIIGDVDPMRMLFFFNSYDERANIVSVGPAEEDEQFKSYNLKNFVIKKIELQVQFSTQILRHRTMEDLLTEYQCIISIHFDNEDGRLTIIGDVDPMRVLFLLNSRDENANIISFGPAEKLEQSKIYNSKNDTIKKVVLEVNVNIRNWQRSTMENLLTNHQGIISIHFVKDQRLTIIGCVDVVRLLSFWNNNIDIKSISAGPAEEYEQSKSYNPDNVVPIMESPFKKIVLEVKFFIPTWKLITMKDLLNESRGIISIHFNNNDERLTIIGGVDPIRVVSIFSRAILSRFHQANIISVGPAEEHEQNKIKNTKNVTIKKIVVGVKSSSQNVVLLVEVLASLPRIISVHFDHKDGLLTIFGDPIWVIDWFLPLTNDVVRDIIKEDGVVDIISIGLAEDHEIEIEPGAEEQKKKHKFGPFSKAASQCSVM